MGEGVENVSNTPRSGSCICVFCGLEPNSSVGHLWISIVRNQRCDLVLSEALLYCAVQPCSACLCVRRKDEVSYKPDACLVPLFPYKRPWQLDVAQLGGDLTIAGSFFLLPLLVGCVWGFSSGGCQRWGWWKSLEVEKQETANGHLDLFQ
jgi:hypothetical protein